MTSKYPSVTIRIDQTMLNRIDEHALDRNISRSEYIKRAIKQAIELDDDAWSED